MKKVLLLVFSMLIVACHPSTSEGIKITGVVKNSDQEFLNLTYIPRLRGNLNFDGFRSTGSFMDANGIFNLKASSITDGANYYLDLTNNGIPLVLFNGDDIALTFDINNPNKSLQATGKGAGKINFLNLKQLAFDNFDFENNTTIAQFEDHIDQVISEQLSLLNAIYTKNQDDKVIAQADNKSDLLKIINDSPLSEKEYHFLISRIKFQKPFLLHNFLSKQSALKKLDSVAIDFNEKTFNFNSHQEYQNLANINDWHNANSLESILQIEYLRKLGKEKNTTITYGNWQSFIDYTEFYDWVSTFLKQNFKEEINDKYFADLSAFSMTLGTPYQRPFAKLNPDKQGNKYIKRLETYENLLKNGLNNKDYALNEDKLTLDKVKFDSLLEAFKDQPLIIVFWSAQYAGASIINLIPSIEAFTKANKGNVNVINICIDRLENKNLWASRIIDNTWNASHYFLPMEGNDDILNKFSDKKISMFCEGGATYAFINKEGVIHNAIEFPFYSSVEEINNLDN